MLKKIKSYLEILKQDDSQTMLKEAVHECNVLLKGDLAHLKIEGYRYTPDEAVKELGLDEDLVEQLVEDYVEQVIKSVVQFEEYLETLQDSKKAQMQLDYTPFRELAHKNLGVARNLRIKDAQTLLYELMKKDDLDYLVESLEALKLCAIKLRPEKAYNTIKLMKIKKEL